MRIEAGQKHSFLAGFASKEERPSLAVPLRPSTWYHRREGTHMRGDPMLLQGMAQTDCSQRPTYAALSVISSCSPASRAVYDVQAGPALLKQPQLSRENPVLQQSHGHVWPASPWIYLSLEARKAALDSLENLSLFHLV